MKIFKKLDIVIIIFLLVISFVPHFVFFKNLPNYNSTYASITIDGKLYDNIPLSSFKGEKKIDIKVHGRINTISITDNKIKMIDANCNDSLCVKQGEISKVSQSIVCLPHKLIIEIKGEANYDEDEDIIISH